MAFIMSVRDVYIIVSPSGSRSVINAPDELGLEALHVLYENMIPIRGECATDT